MSYRSVNTIKFSNILRDRFKREIRGNYSKRGNYSDLRDDEIAWKKEKKENVPHDTKVRHY